MAACKHSRREDSHLSLASRAYTGWSPCIDTPTKTFLCPARSQIDTGRPSSIPALIPFVATIVGYHHVSPCFHLSLGLFYPVPRTLSEISARFGLPSRQHVKLSVAVYASDYIDACPQVVESSHGQLKWAKLLSIFNYWVICIVWRASAKQNLAQTIYNSRRAMNMPRIVPGRM